MKIKVCGITRVDQMRELHEMNVDFAGMIFFEKSKRYAGNMDEAEIDEIRKLPIKRVGVFVNAALDQIKKTVEEFNLDAVQLHGDETPEDCKKLKVRTEVVKVFRISNNIDIDELVEPFRSSCDYFLFDRDTKGYGGSGEQFDWRIIESAEVNKPFFLSGGIGVEDAVRVKKFMHPYLFAVDINSRFEIKPGLKDLNKVQQFVKIIQHG